MLGPSLDLLSAHSNMNLLRVPSLGARGCSKLAKISLKTRRNEMLMSSERRAAASRLALPQTQHAISNHGKRSPRALGRPPHSNATVHIGLMHTLLSSARMVPQSISLSLSRKASMSPASQVRLSLSLSQEDTGPPLGFHYRGIYDFT